MLFFFGLKGCSELETTNQCEACVLTLSIMTAIVGIVWMLGYYAGMFNFHEWEFGMQVGAWLFGAGTCFVFWAYAKVLLGYGPLGWLASIPLFAASLFFGAFMGVYLVLMMMMVFAASLVMDIINALTGSIAR